MFDFHFFTYKSGHVILNKENNISPRSKSFWISLILASFVLSSAFLFFGSAVIEYVKRIWVFIPWQLAASVGFTALSCLVVFGFDSHSRFRKLQVSDLLIPRSAYPDKILTMLGNAGTEFTCIGITLATLKNDVFSKKLCEKFRQNSNFICNLIVVEGGTAVLAAREREEKQIPGRLTGDVTSRIAFFAEMKHELGDCGKGLTIRTIDAVPTMFLVRTERLAEFKTAVAARGVGAQT